MRQSQTAVLERKATFRGEFTTEPFEAGWAAEARWFVKVLELAGSGTSVQLVSQISPDGLSWIDHEASHCQASQVGLHSLPVREFGQWLRLRASVKGDGTATVMIYLTLKS